MARKYQVAFGLDLDQHKALKEIAQQTLVPLAALLRRGVDMVIAEMEHRRQAEDVGLDLLASREVEGANEHDK